MLNIGLLNILSKLGNFSFSFLVKLHLSSCSTTSIKELASSSVVLTCCVRHFILEELLLSKLEGWICADFRGHILERILYATVGPAGLLKLAVLELFNLLIILTAVELGIGFHVLFLLVLGDVC